MTQVAMEAARQLREMADARGVELAICDNMPALVIDVGRLELALVNLISNAIKYSDGKKAKRIVEVTARELGDGNCEICVRDNGIGIPSDRISQIFRRFTRAHTDSPEHDAVTGVGLGLAIVDDCVIAMSGTITVESNEGAGTKFCLIVPMAPTVAKLGDLITNTASSTKPSS